MKAERRVVVFYKTNGNAATHLRCGGIFHNTVIKNVFVILTLKELRKSLVFDEVTAYETVGFWAIL